MKTAPKPSPLIFSSTEHHSLSADSPTERDVDVILTVRPVGNRIVAGLFFDGERPVVWVPKTNDCMDAWLSAFQELLESLDPNQKTRVGVHSRDFLNAIEEFKGAWPHVELVAVPPFHGVVEFVQEHPLFNGSAKGNGAHRRHEKIRRVLVATDGSSGYRGAEYRGGFGWINEHGEYNSGTIRSGSPLDAEVTAIIDALRTHNPNDILHFIVDSTNAIAAVKAAVAGEVEAPVRMSPGLYSQLFTAVQGRRLSVGWVKGHSGHPLNEGADRLSRHARRARAMDVSEKQVQETCSRIAEESMELWSVWVAAQLDELARKRSESHSND